MYACGGALRSCSYTQDFGGVSGAESDNEAKQEYEVRDRCCTCQASQAILQCLSIECVFLL